MSAPTDRNEVKKEITNILSIVNETKTIQGHICVDNTDLFDTSIGNGIYGFPGDEHTTAQNLKVTAWRAMASLYNIGPNDLIILYRTAGSSLGAQEFHGIFQIKKIDDNPIIFTHYKDETYLPTRINKKGKGQFLPYRFLFRSIMKNPLSIPNDLRNQKYQKNNNLDIIKALSETRPGNPSLWGFRHPAVMNIGAARKSSIVDISNTQLRYILQLMLDKGVERPTNTAPKTPQYDILNMPKDVILLNDDYLAINFRKHVTNHETEVALESELYAYFTCSLKNPKSVYHKKIIEELRAINPQLPFNQITENVILGMIPSLHIQEEIDILLCDSEEKNFLIFEMKMGQIAKPDMEQAEKYLQLIKQRFPEAKNVHANIIGTRNTDLNSTDTVKLVAYTIEEFKGVAGVTLTENSTTNGTTTNAKSINLESFLS